MLLWYTPSWLAAASIEASSSVSNTPESESLLNSSTTNYAHRNKAREMANFGNSRREHSYLGCLHHDGLVDIQWLARQ